VARNLIRTASTNPGQVLDQTEAVLAKILKISGSGAGQLYLAPEKADLSDEASKRRLKVLLLSESCCWR
jgi:ATP-dependent Clp protease ATP-binding subunit ClpB